MSMEESDVRREKAEAITDAIGELMALRINRALTRNSLTLSRPTTEQVMAAEKALTEAISEALKP